ncbi:MAG: SDR family oxidoreductase [Mycobacterium sp.]
MSLPLPAADRTVVVTGASSGIGREFGREFVRRGYNVVLVSRSVDKLNALSEELTSDEIRTDVMDVDLADRAARAALPDRIAALGLTVDILVNNAGLSTKGRIATSDPSAELGMIEVDVMAVADLCSRFVPGMVTRGTGAILNVSSAVAFLPVAGQAGYSASKSFVMTYTRCLAEELRGTGVVATALCPGPVDTKFTTTAGFGADDTAMMPPFMWETANDVATFGIDSLDEGRTVAVPGLPTRVATYFGRSIPDRLLIPILSRFHPALRD